MNALGQISSELSAALALDLAAEIWPEADIFKNHGVDPLYGAALMQQPWFRKMVDEAKREWNAIANAKQRIRLKSQLAVEHAIEDMYAVITDKTVPAQARVAAFKELKDVSGVSGVDQEAGGGAAMPTVNIFLGDTQKPAISISAKGRVRSEDEETEVIDVTPSYHGDLIEGLAPLA
jgi:hypothetical protein